MIVVRSDKPKITPLNTLDDLLNVLGKPYYVTLEMSQPKFKEYCEEPLKKDKINYTCLNHVPTFTAEISKSQILDIHKSYLKYKEKTDTNVPGQRTNYSDAYDFLIRKIEWMDARELTKEEEPNEDYRKNMIRRKYEVTLEIVRNKLKLVYLRDRPASFEEQLKEIIKKDKTATFEIEDEDYSFKLHFDNNRWFETEMK